MTQNHISNLHFAPQTRTDQATTTGLRICRSLAKRRIRRQCGLVVSSSSGQSCTTPHAGYWPDGVPCPADRNKIVNIPKTQTPATRTCYQMLGPIGIAVDGVSIYGWTNANSYLNQWAWNWVAQIEEKYIQDLCNGHASSWNEYHYTGEMVSERLNDDARSHPRFGGWLANLGNGGLQVSISRAGWPGTTRIRRSAVQTANVRASSSTNGTRHAASRHPCVGPRTDPSGTIQIPDGHTVSAVSASFLKIGTGTRCTLPRAASWTLIRLIRHDSAKIRITSRRISATVGPSFAEIDTTNGLQSIQTVPVFTILTPTLRFHRYCLLSVVAACSSSSTLQRPSASTLPTQPSATCRRALHRWHHARRRHAASDCRPGPPTAEASSSQSPTRQPEATQRCQCMPLNPLDRRSRASPTRPPASRAGRWCVNTRARSGHSRWPAGIS